MYLNPQSPGLTTVLLIILSMVLSWDIFILYWTQLVLFHQDFTTRMRNVILFTAKYLWSMVLIAVLSLLFITVLVLFAPFSLLVVPFIGLWYILFLSQFIIYEKLNEEFNIEILFAENSEQRS